jgi:hypothetical protein
MKSEGTKRHTHRIRLLAFAATWLALSAALLTFLTFDGYPLLRLEVALALAALVLPALLMALIYVDRRPIRVVLDGLLVGLAVDLVSSGWTWPVAAGLVAAVASFVLRGRLIEFVAVFSGFALLASAAKFGTPNSWVTETSSPSRPTVPSAAGRPAIVHVLLDEHLGVEGFANQLDGRKFADKLKAFYEDRGFSVLDRAYGRHLHTINAIPDALNHGADFKHLERSSEDHQAPRLAYFETLASMGYRTSVTQTEYLDLCYDNAVSNCVTYRETSLIPLSNSSLSADDRAQLILLNYIALSDAVKAAEKKYGQYAFRLERRTGIHLPLSPLRKKQTSTVSTMAAIEQFVTEVMKAKPGEAYFIHALVPHLPYSYEADCRLKDFADWQHPKDATPLSVRQRSYQEQTFCAARLVGRIQDAVASSPAGDNFLFVVHGDHGSRMTMQDPKSRLERIGDSDLIASYSTLFAVRLPDGGNRGIRQAVAIPDLLRSLAENQYRSISAVPDPKPYVWLEDSNWLPRKKIDLPQSF